MAEDKKIINTFEPEETLKTVAAEDAEMEAEENLVPLERLEKSTMN